MKTIEVLYENDEIIIINKPYGLAVQGGSGIVHSVDSVLAEQMGYKIFLVHRLDKNTAGILVTAKSAKAASTYTALFSQGQIKKIYCAICVGSPHAKKGIITTDIIQHGKQKKAQTSYNVEEQSSKIIEGVEYIFTKIFFELASGRMHQIRIHAAQNNFPIVADDKHGNFAFNKLAAKELKIKKMHLAAIELALPIENKETVFSIPLPFHLEQSCKILF